MTLIDTGIEKGLISFDEERNFITYILKDNKIGEFISLFLNTRLGKVLLNREKRDTARAIISYENILNLTIPIPVSSKQKEITNHISDTRKQAQQLKDKTKEAMKKASEEIEKILIN